MNRKTAAIAEINFVGIKLENLLLRETLVQLQGDERLLNLPAPNSLGGEKEAARHLHINRAGALRPLIAPQIRPRRSQNSNGIEPAVLEKALVLGRKHGFDQNLRQIIEAFQ